MDEQSYVKELSKVNETKDKFSLDFQRYKQECEEAESKTRLKEAAGLLDVFSMPKFTSNRPIIGPIIVCVKVSLVWIFNKILPLSLCRQIEFNQKSWNNMYLVYQLEQRLILIEKKLAELESAQARK